jgi:hypothetical protein
MKLKFQSLSLDWLLSKPLQRALAMRHMVIFFFVLTIVPFYSGFPSVALPLVSGRAEVSILGTWMSGI